MQLKPQSEYLLCKQVNADADVQQKGIFFYQEVVPQYEVADVSVGAATRGFEVGDVILANCIPTKAKVGNTMFFLVHSDNVVGKIGLDE